jgi:hypothetical protein
MRGLATTAVMLLIACGDSTGPMTQLAAAQARWEANGPDSYVFTVHRECFCGPEGIGPVRVDVVAGGIQSRTYVDGSTVPANLEAVFPDVPGLFAMVAETIAGRPSHLSVEYHPQYGFPAKVIVDFSSSVADDEVIYTTSLEPADVIH